MAGVTGWARLANSKIGFSKSRIDCGRSGRPARALTSSTEWAAASRQAWVRRIITVAFLGLDAGSRA